MRFTPILLILALLYPISAHAAITEIRNHYWAQTQALPATAILSAPTSDSSYLLAIALEDITCSQSQGKNGSFATAIVRWSDENGMRQAYQSPGGGVCTVSRLLPVRVRAGTAPTLQVELTAGCQSCSYNVFVDGLGFSSLTQGQGGLAEPVNLQWLKQTTAQTLTLPSLFNNLFLVSFLIVPHGAAVTGTLTWWGDTGKSQMPVAATVAFIHASGGTSPYAQLQISGAVSSGYDVYIRGITFGTPALGPGPLTQYAYNLLDWTNATYPALKTVLTVDSSALNIMLVSNIAEKPNTGGVSEGLSISGGNLSSVPCNVAQIAGPSGAPANCVAPTLLSPNTTLQLKTYNTPGAPWGASPLYSAEVNVIQF